MNRLLLGVTLTLLVCGGALSLGLSGCASTNAALEQHSAAVNLVASVATMKYIEASAPAERSARASKVRVVAGAISELAGKDSITLADLAAVAVAKIPNDLAPSDRVLAVALVQVIEQELEARYGKAGIDADNLVSLKAVLGAVDQAAAFYVTS